MVDDPERARLEELLNRVRTGAVTEAETEELALYNTGDPEFERTIADRRREGALGGGWLARVEADHQVARIEDSGRARFERGVGLAFFGAGIGASLFAPITGALAITFGVVILLASLIRTRLASARQDPYKDIQR